jgi:hypothetical protein
MVDGMTWRKLDGTWPVEAFIAETWVETVACEIEVETRELRVHWPPGEPVHHLVRDPSRYRLMREEHRATVRG